MNEKEKECTKEKKREGRAQQGERGTMKSTIGAAWLEGEWRL